MIDMITIMLGFGLKLLGAVVAFVVARLALSNLDSACGFDFKEWMRKADAEDVSRYLGYRILAIAVLFGLIL